MGNCQTFQEDDVAKCGPKPKGSVHLVIKTDTWLRDSYGLFDYENANIVTNTLRSYSSGKIVRTGTGVSFIKQNEGSNETQDRKGLFQVQAKDGNFWISSSASQKSLDAQQEIAGEDNERDEHGLWAVVKTLKGKNNTRGSQLIEGDLIKLGRIKMRIVEQRAAGKPARKAEVEVGRRAVTEPDSPLEVEGIDEGVSKGSISSKDLNSNVCRICLSETEPGNPLFSPCKCSGTMKHVHIKCLQMWLNSKLHIKEAPQVTSYFMKSFECELCKTLYPNTFDVSGVKYDVIDVKRPKKAPYLILEVLGKDGTMLRGLHMIRLDKKNSIKLGRGHESDIRISDISVSRYHASIKMDKDGFHLEDINSKFGTLIYLKKPFPITGMYENVSIQVGRTVANFGLKKNWKLFSSHSKNSSISQVGVLNEPQFIKRESGGPTINKDRPSNVPSTVLDIRERTVRIPNRAGLQPRNNRDSNRAPQRPLGGDDDLIDMEEVVNQNNNNREPVIEDIGAQGRDIEVVEVLE